MKFTKLGLYRTLLMCAGFMISAFGSALYVYSGLGADAFNLMVQGVSGVLGLAIGTTSSLIQFIFLALLIFVSPYHLAHVFKQHTGYTLKQYILRRRIGEAQDRLSCSSDSITQIAREVGFEDSAYFSRIFTKYVGMSPKFYREYRTGSDE